MNDEIYKMKSTLKILPKIDLLRNQRDAQYAKLKTLKGEQNKIYGVIRPLKEEIAKLK